jgi:hypothetical protein
VVVLRKGREGKGREGKEYELSVCKEKGKEW